MSTYHPTEVEVARLISQPRLARYRHAAGNDLRAALDLYRWNLAISASLWESMHYFEIAFRNSIDAALTDLQLDRDPDGPAWYRNAHIPLSDGSRRKANVAVARATDNGASREVAGRVIAELTFGFWWSLLGPAYNRSLWPDALRDAFPAARRASLHAAFERMLLLRNRIAHHEPLIGLDLASDYQLLIRTSEYISPRLAWWIDSTTSVPDVLGRRADT